MEKKGFNVFLYKILYMYATLQVVFMLMYAIYKWSRGEYF